VNETTERIGRGFSGDPEAEKENANEEHREILSELLV